MRIEEDFSGVFSTLFGDTLISKALDDGRTFTWKPKSGITTEELALCMYLVPFVVTGTEWQHHAEIYDKLPPNAQRHFEVVKTDWFKDLEQNDTH